MAEGLKKFALFLLKGLKRFTKSQLFVPLFALFLIIIFNLIRDINFFSITTNSIKDAFSSTGYKYDVLQGNIISVFSSASELVILAIGMTLVTASSKGQDISVGAGAAIAGAVFVSVLLGSGEITLPLILLAFLASCVVAVVLGVFNGTLVAVFRIQPMIASLILFSAGRSIAYWIAGGESPVVGGPLVSAIGSFIPGIPIQTRIFISIIFVALASLVLRFTNLRLYAQAVGINERSARLNGINATWIKLLSFMILGVCVALAGCVRVCNIGIIQPETLLVDSEMDAILAVAIGGNALSGGKFSLAGSVIGAYVISALTVTLNAMRVPSTAVKAYKAVVIIAIVVLSSPITQKYALKLRDKLFGMLRNLFKKLRGKKPTNVTES